MCEASDKCVTEADAADISSVWVHFRERSRSHRDWKSKAHYRFVALPAALRCYEMRFSLHESPLLPEFHYLYLRVERNKAVWPALETCHPARTELFLWRQENVFLAFTHRSGARSLIAGLGRVSYAEMGWRHSSPLALFPSLPLSSPFRLLALSQLALSLSLSVVTLPFPKSPSASLHSQREAAQVMGMSGLRMCDGCTVG